MAAFPIRNDDDLARAFERIDELWGAADGTSERDELDMLVVLVEAYEAERYALPAGDPIEVIRFKLEELGWTQGDLARRLGWGSGRVSEILNKRRGLTLAMVRDLAEALGLSAGSLSISPAWSKSPGRTCTASNSSPKSSSSPTSFGRKGRS